MGNLNLSTYREEELHIGAPLDRPAIDHLRQRDQQGIGRILRT